MGYGHSQGIDPKHTAEGGGGGGVLSTLQQIFCVGITGPMNRGRRRRDVPKGVTWDGDHIQNDSGALGFS